ncbi:MAG: signal peptidase I [Pirellulaceae bacterium]|jgi:signal peptidase I|nr:signal peptidase I [Pirellulaceae bacterium]
MPTEQQCHTPNNESLQPTCYPHDCSTVTEDGELFDGSSRHGVARTRLNSAYCSETSVESTIVKPRRPWLAALMSLLGGPLGQIYAGRLRRSLVLWGVGAVLLPILAFATISLPIGCTGFAVLLLCMLGFPIYLTIDAYMVAKHRRDVPLRRYQRWWVYLLAFVAFAIANNLVAHTVRAVVAEAFVVPTRAMSPTILPGDRILVDKLWCQPTRLRRNDIVVFRSEGPDSPLYVMRLVGLPGDKIEVVDEKVLLNGKEWSDLNAVVDLDLPPYPELSNYGPIHIPSGSFFVLGDNRRLSKDSRVIGAIPLSDLHGKARMIYWSHERRFPDPWDTSYYEVGPIGWSRIGTRLD